MALAVEGKSWTITIRGTNLQMFGMASFLVLFTAAASAAAVEGLDDGAQRFAYSGQRVELYCKREANSDVNDIFWLKNGEIWFRFGFKENYDIVLNKSYAKLIIPSVEENDAGIYQCGFELTKLTVLNISETTTKETSDYKHIDLLQKILNSIFVNRLFLITLLLGAGIIVAFYIQRYWRGKYRQDETNAGQQESLNPLIDEFQKSVAELRTMQGVIITNMVKQSEDLDSLQKKVVSKIDNLKDNVAGNHNTIVIALKQQSNNIKNQVNAVKGIQEILQQSLPSDKHGISVTDAFIDG